VGAEHDSQAIAADLVHQRSAHGSGTAGTTHPVTSSGIPGPCSGHVAPPEHWRTCLVLQRPRTIRGRPDTPWCGSLDRRVAPGGGMGEGKLTKPARVNGTNRRRLLGHNRTGRHVLLVRPEPGLLGTDAGEHRLPNSAWTVPVTRNSSGQPVQRHLRENLTVPGLALGNLTTSPILTATPSPNSTTTETTTTHRDTRGSTDTEATITHKAGRICTRYA